MAYLYIISIYYNVNIIQSATFHLLVPPNILIQIHFPEYRQFKREDVQQQNQNQQETIAATTIPWAPIFKSLVRDALDDWSAAGDAPVVVVDVFLVLLLEDLGDLVLLGALVLLRILVLLLGDLGDLVLLGALVLLCIVITLDPRNGTLLEFWTFCWKPSVEITILEIVLLGSDNAKVWTEESKARERNAFKFIVLYVVGKCLARNKIMSRAVNIMERSQKKGLDWTDTIGQIPMDRFREML